jgi:NAD(P)-dependent dehydrogenase (short-subunit alcohol dehydrogenase family)
MNPVALITGASRGIGRGIALEVAGLGHDLVINYASRKAEAEETATLCQARAQAAGRSIRAEICQADISCASDRQKLLKFIEATFGRLSVLVNNAGVAPSTRADLLEETEENFDRLIGINAKGPYFLTQAAAKWMIRQVEARGVPLEYVPCIITVSSMSAYTASTNRGGYCVSKAALSMLTSLFAVRLAEYGIRVYEIRPGIIATDMTGPVKDKYDALIADGLTPLPRWGTPEDVGKAVSAVVQGLMPFSTGEVINVDGGFHLRRL